MATVTIGCKLPNGLVLHLGGVTFAVLNGSNASALIGGHGITEGVDKEKFEEWLRVNKDSPAVVNDLVFAHEKPSEVAAKAKANAQNKTGLEPVDPDAPVPGVVKEDGK